MTEKSINQIMNREYLVTNGFGGYSFKSIYGPNVRKYHGEYIASFNPPIERWHLVSDLGIAIMIKDQVYSLYESIEKGKESIESSFYDMHQEGTLTQIFKLQGMTLQKKIAYLPESQMMGVQISLLEWGDHEPDDVQILLRPSVNFRDHHETIPVKREDYQYVIRRDINRFDDKALGEDETVIEVEASGKTCYWWTDADFEANLTLASDTLYPIETERGYPDEENSLVMGSIMTKKHQINLVINIEALFEKPETIFEAAEQTARGLVQQAGFKDDLLNQLVLASDQFIVNRASTGLKTVIAGYPWFTDWGRDTMIALEGLTLTTKRYEDAFEMIKGFIYYMNQGIIPNNFPDQGQKPMYNTSDGTLWLFNAIYAYYERTQDLQGIASIYSKLLESIDYHMKGTINDIYMDQDGLLSTGNPSTQLTWMDVKVNGWVVTPRHGKAVEINALWYNALSITAVLGHALKSKEGGKWADTLTQEQWQDVDAIEALCPKVKKAFNERFINRKAGRLYDLIIEDQPVDIPRPNMIFAVSLPFAVLNESDWQRVVDYVTDHFKTPVGLRTLEVTDENYHGIYTGDLLSRDGAYHRGTVWGWLMGPYLQAHYKTYHDKATILKWIEDLRPSIQKGVVGSISEVFDGDAPHQQRGCPAQAWSVAEIIRVYEWL